MARDATRVNTSPSRLSWPRLCRSPQIHIVDHNCKTLWNWNRWSGEKKERGGESKSEKGEGRREKREGRSEKREGKRSEEKRRGEGEVDTGMISYSLTALLYR